MDNKAVIVLRDKSQSAVVLATWAAMGIGKICTHGRWDEGVISLH